MLKKRLHSKRMNAIFFPSHARIHALHTNVALSISFLMQKRESSAGLKIERARVPGARSFAVGHAAFASCVPGVHALVSLLFF